MKEKMNRMARGYIDGNLPEITLSATAIEETISYNTIYKAEFSLKDEKRRPFRGLVFSSNILVRPISESFSGSTCYIPYFVDPMYEKPGNVIDGEFKLITNGGEFVVPYRFTIEMQSSDDADNKETETTDADASDNVPFISYDDTAASDVDHSSAMTRILIEQEKERLSKTIPPEDAAALYSGIVEMLIRSGRLDSEAFDWYQSAIEKNISVQKLYDYYLLSVPDDYTGQFPREIYLYYSFNAPDDDRAKKRLYVNTINNFTKTSSIYKGLERQMFQFVTDEVMQGHIDEDLAGLYGTFLSAAFIDENLAAILPDILLTHSLKVPAGTKYVLVTYDELSGEQKIEVKGNTVYIPLYTENYSISCVIEDGTKHIVNKMSLKHLMNNTAELHKVCMKLAPSLPVYQIVCAHRLEKQKRLNDEQFEQLYAFAFGKGISKSFRLTLASHLINSYEFTREGSIEKLITLSEEKIGPDERNRVVMLLAKARMYKNAKEQIAKVGYKHVSIKTLMQIFTEDETEDSFRLYVAKYLYDNDQINGTVMEYLIKNYNGLCSELYELLSRALRMKMNIEDLPERLLCQQLFVNKYENADEIFKIYAQNCSVDGTLLRAYFSLLSYKYFVLEESINMEIFEAALEILTNDIIKGISPVIVQLAVTKYYSETDKLTGDDEIICKNVLTNLCQKGIVFPYFKKFNGLINLSEKIKDKTIISYRGRENDSVALIIYPENDENPIFSEMHYVCDGIFVKSILLFAGECETYEIRVTRNGVSEIAVRGELRADITSDDPNRKFIRLNTLIDGAASPSDEEWQKSMEAYAYDEELNKALFKL